MKPVTVVGGGLAGCEAAWQLARSGVPVTLFEMRPTRKTEAHQGDRLAELVCSNSFRSDNPHNAIGVLHRELRACNSLILQAGDDNRVPAGDALAVDREGFARQVTAVMGDHPLIDVRREEVTALPDGDVILATGPLTSPALTQVITALTGREGLAFYDAIAPIVDPDSLDMDVIFAQSRYDKGGADYLNCPMDKGQYEAFIKALLAAEKVAPKEFEKDVHYFPGCLPIEVMAEQGFDTLRYGPMKPVGLTDPRTNERPWAVVQLRKENREGTAYNLVGFQTRMKYLEQRRVLRLIPGMEAVAFFRMGSVHRNTFINSPALLNAWMGVKDEPRVRFAGQITGVEGYVESTGCGLLVAWSIVAQRNGHELAGPPPETALGAMMGHLRSCYSGTFQPQNVNFGLFPRLPRLQKKLKKFERKAAHSERAAAAMDGWLEAVLPQLSRLG
jgi:methylenetetrahydrofolate--tRNA-(uracil-5-)-methyltransferase